MSLRADAAARVSTVRAYKARSWRSTRSEESSKKAIICTMAFQRLLVGLLQEIISPKAAILQNFFLVFFQHLQPWILRSSLGRWDFLFHRLALQTRCSLDFLLSFMHKTLKKKYTPLREITHCKPNITRVVAGTL
jgi:hypothetical protein